MFSNYEVLEINARVTPPQDKVSFPTVKVPSHVGEYSLSPEGHFENSSARICFLSQPALIQLPIALALCNEDAGGLSIPKPRYLDNFFYFLRCSFKNFIKRNDEGVLHLDADIVCSLEALQLIMCAPYEYKKNWTLAISKYRNTIYMCPVQNTQQALSQPIDLLKAKWMRALRKRCLIAGVHPTGISNGSQDRNLEGQYYCIFRTEISGIHVLFDAPILAEHSINTSFGLPKTFVDLKLRTIKMKPSEWANHNRSDVLKWWVESFLTGIEKIYIAYHDRQGNVHKIINRKLRELWRDCEHDWSPNICGHFLSRCLGNIKTLLANVDSASTVYLLEYDAENGNLRYKYATERSEYTFIPDWFRLMMEESLEHLNAATQFQI